jgi:hypothetical protein
MTINQMQALVLSKEWILVWVDLSTAIGPMSEDNLQLMMITPLSIVIPKFLL